MCNYHYIYYCSKWQQSWILQEETWVKARGPIITLTFYFMRGLRFTYHPLCRGLKLTHLMFADDLILFCKGNVASVFTLVVAFDFFSKASGLHINTDKTDIMFIGRLQPEVEDIIVRKIGFKKGSLPFKYLGVNISHKKLSKMECAILVDKMIHRIKGCNKRRISYTGRLVLVKSVLATLHNY
ncbi:uncharacterized protein LOC141629326 [Silene latifolia]|uniref:uncharacterized protein LOC141629326 n=1 Tax=Silene latifolia TaxID=37657 RepID=UPI003D76D7F0